MNKMKLIPVYYYGFTAMDRRFSSPMLPWVVSEIRKRDSQEKLSLGVEDGHLQAYNADFEIQFSHIVTQMTRFSQADLDPCTFLYLLRDDVEQLLYCYLYQAMKQDDVTELYQRMKENSTTNPPPTRSMNNSTSNLTSLCLDISPSSSNFFEVLYIGKIKVWHKKVPDTFIDDALVRFKEHDLEKNRKKLARLKSEMDLRRGSINHEAPLRKLQRSHSLMSDMTIKSPDIDRQVPSNGNNKENVNGQELDRARMEHEVEDHNRTMVLQVDRTDLRLISPDRKVILLQKHHRDITTCVQGVENSCHFGFITREASNANAYIGFVFKCESPSVANETVSAITQAFNNVDLKQSKPTITSCEHCPMVWYHKMCCDVENLSDRKTQAAIFRRIEQLDDDEQNLIQTKYQGAETDSLREQNEFLMMLLRAHCEMKQLRHIHDTAENRSEFLNQYLGGSTIFMKARRSLSNSFDHLLKRRSSKDDFAAQIKELHLPIYKENGDCSDKDSDGFRSRSSTTSSQEHLQAHETKCSISPDRHLATADKLKSPMMDIFLKVGSSPKTPSMDVALSPKLSDNGSWRQAIFKRAITPSKPDKLDGQKRSREELRELWRKGIDQAILLVRMEKENARIRAKQEESAVKRIKLEYDDMRSQLNDSTEVWDLMSNNDPRITCDNKLFLQAMRQGIPRTKRGDVWFFLAEGFCAKLPPIDLNKHPNYNVPYETLLKHLTSHQHAILIDLGRTFPSHPYYSSPLGPGQLSLFNLLKAYSLLDPEVGYCQGLSFVAGVLLLHLEESQAFFLLRHLMYRRELRKQYLPDMVGLQVKLYQLSRLLHDQLPEVYAHFDLYEVAPTLYAAPWLLTIFASQFPLGFVTRVFDLIFMENADIIFRIILALLSFHKESILACDSFEDIMNYLKNKLPAMDKCTLEKILKQVYSIDISKQLSEYNVEYFVLQEEIQSVQPHVEALHKLETHNKALSDQNKSIVAQLEVALANIQRLDKNSGTQQGTINKLEVQNRSLEVTILTLGNFINGLIEDKVDLEMPGEVRRIVSQISNSTERRRSNNNIFNMFKKDAKPTPNRMMVKSLSTGKISFNNGNHEQVRSNSFIDSKIIKKSNFFSNTHKDILDHKLFSHNFLDNKIDMNELDEEQNDTISPSPSIDSGISTISPTDSLNNNSSSSAKESSHPLSNCDINFTYQTRELKKVRNRSASIDEVK